MNAITPLQRWKRDDWTIPCTLQDASGTAVDLTGSQLFGELWLPGYQTFQPLTPANGGIVRVSDGQGKFKVVAPRALTALATSGFAGSDPRERTRILVYRIDTLGTRQTLGVIVFDVFDVADTRTIDQIPAAALVSQSTTLTLIVATAQGAAGPSQIAAAAITDGTEIGRSVLRATDAAAARAALGVPSIGRSAVNDTNYPVKATDTYVGVAALTAPRTLTLPPAATYPPGQPLCIADESGACGTSNPIIIAAAGQDSIGSEPNVTMQSPYQKAVLHSNGSNLWTL
ncbi:hypothetical protein [Methylobacterium persicinum]|uniref:Uncharacterized protein n=1 Tax=Methylobacterium persicinum TaxID=374426 RepID=A0ABU0HQT0_9HYPH|nr:hypothetical protein [Methylobacterium persicinum]MDQ0444676.1 hypothetical protein [Methylobacterium persicinum]GJE38546.1 hypothetical protein KHHGKMAE_2619 [Methylobacterium persicinum]